jgi:adenylate cyclase class IV
LTSVDPPAHGQEQTTIPTNKRRLALSTSNELRNPHYQHDDYYDYETEYYNRQRKVPRIRTKQEEELLKILSKHKKETVDKLLQSWKLSKLKEVGWL